jgi:23S rRNA (adenine2030-N6)-methyltransferase
MNYRHAFHAGNFADVFKHVFLTRILHYLTRKEAALRVIDTHAGEGVYDLSAVPAQKTAEWCNGIKRLVAATPPPEVQTLLEPYLSVVTPLLAADPPLYPGSPALARRLLRRRDRMIFCDAHNDTISSLKACCGRDRRAKIIEIDGFVALKAFVPPIERRGLVLIDPPFEERTEFADLGDALALAARKWPTGVYMAWFPIKDHAVVNDFIAALVPRLIQAGIKNLLRLDLQVDTPHPDAPLVASGLVVLNPPYPLAMEARAVLPYLTQTMGTGRCAADIVRLIGD